MTLFRTRDRLARVETELRMLTEQLDVMRGDRDYWRTRAERLLDNALYRKGETVQPVFTASQAPPLDKALGSVFGPLAVTEIESGKRRAESGDGGRPDQ